MLADLLGYEKYVEISTEFAVKGTYVDLAVEVGKEIYFLVQRPKAIGVELKDIHVRQGSRRLWRPIKGSNGPW